ncbi:hypothetical protein A1O1_03565 [Capronia coronata CBS 617.96]|uniref:BD-FAE-like domain-containing protein n=1 Tax=Capronia coronata CBS 617.96 TaxID=1182541 RepID=W9YC70_9EURO|nr:uncharacterized protein A1O1_03565 [Capronia coronata CBS 617.96]EXJ90462.1 hypothetical protein A1O1_03565 [Capronia coronata CBS 617.96]
MGVSGHIRLDVISPHPSTIKPEEPRNLLVYLPPGPSIGHDSTSTPSVQRLACFQAFLPPTTSHVVINYRLGLNEDSSEITRFPVPIHDVSTAFEFLTSSTSPFNRGQDRAPRICLVGSHIGGALATMLALTEPNSVHALAAIEPMVDWVGLDELVEQLLAAESRKRHIQKTAARYGVDNPSVLAAAEELIKLRAKLFGTPSSYFDPFASPTLFLRAPGRDTPWSTTVGDRLVSEMGLDENDGGSDNESNGNQSSDTMSQPYASSTASTTSSETVEAALVTDNQAISSKDTESSPRRRKVLRRWPAIGNPDSVLLPHVKVIVRGQLTATPVTTPLPSDRKAVSIGLGLAALKHAQGIELAELMRRACFLGRERGFAEERVSLHEEKDATNSDLPHDSTEWAKLSVLGNLDPRKEVAPDLRSTAVNWLHGMFQQE